MPDAFSMKSGVDSRSGVKVPAAISAAWAAFSRLTQTLKAWHSSSLVTRVSGCHTPDPVIAVPVDPLIMRGPYTAGRSRGTSHRDPVGRTRVPRMVSGTGSALTHARQPVGHQVFLPTTSPSAARKKVDFGSAAI